MSRVILRNDRVVETNDEILRMPYDDVVAALLEPDSYAATLLAVEGMRDMSEAPIDKNSYEWEEYSKYMDKIFGDVEKNKRNIGIAGAGNAKDATL